jgi:hypothetical protein
MPKSVQPQSSNIYQYQPGYSALSDQSHPQITHHNPAIAPESSIASAVGSARLGAHNAASGVENAPPQRTPDGRIGESLAQKRLRQESQTSQKSASHSAISTHQSQLPPDTNPALHERPVALHQQRDVPDTTEPGSDAKRPHGGVRQDKDRSASDRIASRQPASVYAGARSRETSRYSTRSQKPSADTARTVYLQVWVRPFVKQELSRLAAQDGLSLSATGAAFLERALQQNIDLQYGALLTPIIERAIARQMGPETAKLCDLAI